MMQDKVQIIRDRIISVCDNLFVVEILFMVLAG